VSTRVGRPPAPGVRTPVNFRMRVDLKAVAQLKAAKLGLSFTDYIAQLVSQDTGFTPDDEAQEGLPFADVA
jgi:hypothetical protein